MAFAKKLKNLFILKQIRSQQTLYLDGSLKNSYLVKVVSKIAKTKLGKKVTVTLNN